MTNMITFPKFGSKEYEDRQKLGNLLIRSGQFTLRHNKDNLKLLEKELIEDEKKGDNT